MPVTAPGCQTMNALTFAPEAPRPAASKKAGQSRPGARVENSASGQRLLARCTSIDSVRVAWVAAIFASRA